MRVVIVSLCSLCRLQVQVFVYSASRIHAHPVLNPVDHYQYLLPTVYLSVADIANPDLFVCGCRTWNSLDITLFYEVPAIQRASLPPKM